MTLKIGVVGAGYVGLTTAVCLSDRGIDTLCMDIDEHRVSELRAGHTVIDEPELTGLMRRGLDRGTLRFTRHYRRLRDRDVVFVCVPTPAYDDGSTDLRAVESVIANLAATLVAGATVVMKSTVPVGTCDRLGRDLAHSRIHLVVSPEFLREGRAVSDCSTPERVVIGASDQARDAAERVAAIYDGEKVLRMSAESAELAKYASNAFLAIKLSFVNSLAELCARTGAEVGDVTACMGADGRIGPHFLAPGPGWGGSCLPKDTAALLHTGAHHGTALPEVQSACQTNAAQVGRITAALRNVLGRPLERARVTVLGLTFKAGTTDVRDSPALSVCAALQRIGAQVTAYDPSQRDGDALPVATVADPYLATKDADAIVVLTEWPEFGELDWHTVEKNAAPGAVVIDTRNIVDRRALGDSGLAYLRNGAAGGY